jgi:hypothetical protein
LNFRPLELSSDFPRWPSYLLIDWPESFYPLVSVRLFLRTGFRWLPIMGLLFRIQRSFQVSGFFTATENDTLAYLPESSFNFFNAYLLQILLLSVILMEKELNMLVIYLSSSIRNNSEVFSRLSLYWQPSIKFTDLIPLKLGF